MLTANQIEATYTLIGLIDKQRTILKRKAWFKRGLAARIQLLDADRNKVSELLSLVSLHTAMSHEALSQGITTYKPQEKKVLLRALEEIAAKYGVQGLEYDAHNHQLSHIQNTMLSLSSI